MECPKCGAENSSDRSSCKSCFASLSSAPSANANKVVVGTPKSNAPPSGTLQADGSDMSERPREVPRVNRSEPSRGGKGFPAVIPIVVVLVALIAAWWFLLANPKPEAAAKRFVEAMNSMVSGDTKPLKSIASADSKNIIGELPDMASQPPGGQGLKITVGDIKSCTVTGNKADVNIETGISIGGKEFPFKVPMNVSLVKEGSFICPKWKVDLAKSAPSSAMGGNMPGMMR
ncbi:MAG: hypothetical protein ACYC27_09565 [Armatimonadota bacterium]